MIGGQGLGQLTPYQQYLAANPQCLDANGNVVCQVPASVMNATTAIWASSPAYQPAAVVPASTVAIVQSPTFATMPFGTSSTTTLTLDSFMAQWAAGAITSADLLGQDPVAIAASVAQTYCVNENPPDCGQMSAIALKYGQQVAQAYAAKIAAASAQPSPQPPPNPPALPALNVRGQTPAINLPPPANPPSPPPPPVVVNPSPPSQPTTTGSSITAPGSVLSQANGTTVAAAPATSADLIPGLPNEVLFLGGAAAVLLFFMGGK